MGEQRGEEARQTETKSVTIRTAGHQECGLFSMKLSRNDVSSPRREIA